MERKDDGSALQIPTLPLSAKLPGEGKKVLGLGYANFDVTSFDVTPDGQDIEVDPNFHYTTGEVTEVHRAGRPGLPTACFRTSARFERGMSGGPVIDERGAVCGVIASGIDETTDDEGFVSYASGTPFIFILGITIDGVTTTIYDLASSARNRGDRSDISIIELRVARGSGRSLVSV